MRVREAKPPEAESFVVRRPNEVAKLAHFWENLTTHLDLQGGRVYLRLFGVREMTAKLTSLHRI